MRRDGCANAASLAPCAHALVDRVAREPTPETRSEEGRRRSGRTARLDIRRQHLGQLRIQRNHTLMAAFSSYANRQLLEIDIPL